MKTFYLSDEGLISQHKLRQKVVVGMGIIHPDQKLVVRTTSKVREFKYTDIKVSGHLPRQLFYRDENELVVNIDIITPPKPVFKSAEEYLASDMAKEDAEEV